MENASAGDSKNGERVTVGVSHKAILGISKKGGSVIGAEGEYQASTRLSEASDILSGNPMALMPRYLQTLNEISTRENST